MPKNRATILYMVPKSGIRDIRAEMATAMIFRKNVYREIFLGYDLIWI